MKPFVLITRPQEDAAALADEVRALGFSPVTEPMLEIAPLETAPPPPDDYQALVFTSANGARGFAAMTGDRRHPVYCTGDATAAAARALGWSAVKSAAGDAGDLMALLAAEKLDPVRPLLHPAGEHLARAIEVPGLEIERLTIYRAEKAQGFSAKLLEVMDKGDLAAALFFSARTAEVFAELLEKYGRTAAVGATKSLCLSDSVVKSLRHLNWQDVQVAARPDRDGMRALLEDLSLEIHT